MRDIIVLTCGIALAASGAAAQSARQSTPPGSELAAYPGFGHNPERDSRSFAADVAKREQIKNSCMREAGFEYFPEVGRIIRGDPPSNERARSARAPSRNEAYREGLQGERRIAYNIALWGVQDPNSETELWDPNSTTGGGCWGEALRAVPGVYQASGKLRREYQAMRNSVYSDSAVAAADQRWAQCMAGRGHQFENIRRMRLLVASGGNLPGEAPVRIESPQAVLAAAEECSAEANLQSVYEAARVRAENEFVRRHKATLDRHRYSPQ